MELEEAHRLADRYRLATFCLSDSESATVILDDRITELEGESLESEIHIDELEAKLIEQEIVEKEIKRLLDRITELEGQRNLLFAATEEMLNLIESSDFEDDDAAPNNDDMNRWHGAVQDAIIPNKRITELEKERLNLRTLIRGEQIKPPFDIEDDVTTELAVALADMEKQRDELKAKVKSLTQMVRRREAHLNVIERMKKQPGVAG